MEAMLVGTTCESDIKTPCGVVLHCRQTFITMVDNTAQTIGLRYVPIGEDGSQSTWNRKTADWSEIFPEKLTGNVIRFEIASIGRSFDVCDIIVARPYPIMRYYESIEFESIQATPVVQEQVTDLPTI